MRLLGFLGKLAATVATIPLVVLCGAFGGPCVELIGGLRRLWGVDGPAGPRPDSGREPAPAWSPPPGVTVDPERVDRELSIWGYRHQLQAAELRVGGPVAHAPADDLADDEVWALIVRAEAEWWDHLAWYRADLPGVPPASPRLPKPVLWGRDPGGP